MPIQETIEKVKYRCTRFTQTKQLLLQDRNAICNILTVMDEMDQQIK